jgi:predicted  nucleic acid-binding Zn-ribbon protein
LLDQHDQALAQMGRISGCSDERLSARLQQRHAVQQAEREHQQRAMVQLLEKQQHIQQRQQDLDAKDISLQQLLAEVQHSARSRHESMSVRTPHYPLRTRLGAVWQLSQPELNSRPRA